MPLVTFEGVEGCGKSTQLARAAEGLRRRGAAVLETREPGGTAIGRRIREILLDVGNAHLDPAAEWLLYEADRRQHVVEMIRPALDRSEFVLCDRFSDSTEAYQQAGRGIEASAIRFVDAVARGGLSPDLTLVFDLDPSEGLARARRRDGHVGRFESEDLAFHERVRTSFLEIARREPDRVRVIPAGGSADDVFARTWEALADRFSVAR